MDLAREFSIDDYPNASGGCLLTDPQFSKKLKDLISHQALNLEDVGLLKIGRHFRLSEKAKLIVGRDEEESRELELNARGNDYIFMPNQELAGPTCLGRGEFDNGLIQLSLQVACHYCDLNTAKSARLIYYRAGISPREEFSLEVSPVMESQLKLWRL